ncbi:MAG: hypothetical protein V1779_00160 [bacterium]
MKKFIMILIASIFVITYYSNAQDGSLEEKIDKLETELKNNKELINLLMERILILENKLDNLSALIKNIDTQKTVDSLNQDNSDDKIKNDKTKVKTKVQCKGRTKKGKRCTRMTDDPSGYCWQHKK